MSLLYKVFWSMAAILDVQRGHQVQLYTGASWGSFHQSLLLSGQAGNRRRFLNIFPIRSYVDNGRLGWQVTSLDKLLKEENISTIPIKFWPNRLGRFRGEDFFTIESQIKTMSVDVDRLGWRAQSLGIILKGDHLRTILLKFGPNRPSSFREVDFENIFSHRVLC